MEASTATEEHIALATASALRSKRRRNAVGIGEHVCWQLPLETIEVMAISKGKQLMSYLNLLIGA